MKLLAHRMSLAGSFYSNKIILRLVLTQMSKNKNYEKGVKLEREVIKIFKENGWEAFRSAGSHSPFDVVLIKYGLENKKICFAAFIQCKVKKLK